MKFVLAVLLALTSCHFAVAQTPSGWGPNGAISTPFEPFPPPYNPYLPSPLSGTPAVATGNASGAAVSAAGDVSVATRAGSVVIPTNVTAQVASSRIAQAAAAATEACLSPLGLVACPAAAAAAVGSALKAAGVGYHQCPSGVFAFICKDPSPSDQSAAGSYWKYAGSTNSPYVYTSPADACSAIRPGSTSVFSSDSAYYCYSNGAYNGYIAARDPSNCQSGYEHDANGLCVSSSPVPVPATSDQVQSDLQTRFNQDYAENQRILDALRQSQREQPDLMPPAANPYDGNTPVSVQQSPVTTPKKTDSVEQVPKPDGSTDTITKESQTTVTPTTTGTTADTIHTTYQSSTVITTTTTNNVTNNTTVTNETVNENAAPDTSDLCKAHPDASGCIPLGTPPQPEAIPRQDVPVTYTPVEFASNASCPSPITYDLGRFGGAKAISWQPMCDWLGTIRPLFLALGALACAWIFMESLKS